MSAPKVAVIFYSSTGNTHKMAEAVAEGARAAGAEVRMKPVAELAPEAAIAGNPAWKAYYEANKNLEKATLADLEWADAIILGSPTRFGNVASQLKQYVDTTGGLWFQGKLTNKVTAGFVTAGNAHGGHESTLLALYHTFYHWGTLVVAPGYTDQAVYAAGGNPYGASATGTEKGVSAEELAAAKHMGNRVATVSKWVLAGRQG